MFDASRGARCNVWRDGVKWKDFGGSRSAGAMTSLQRTPTGFSTDAMDATACAGGVLHAYRRQQHHRRDNGNSSQE
jgi:hypothetical protein